MLGGRVSSMVQLITATWAGVDSTNKESYDIFFSGSLLEWAEVMTIWTLSCFYTYEANRYCIVHLPVKSIWAADDVIWHECQGDRTGVLLTRRHIIFSFQVTTGKNAAKIYRLPISLMSPLMIILASCDCVNLVVDNFTRQQVRYMVTVGVAYEIQTD